MKLVHIGLDTHITFDRDYVNEWVIESPNLFMQYIRELLNQLNGKDGEFVLSEEEKIENISKSVEIIINPFGVDINDKKILNKIYDQLIDVANNEKNYVYTHETTNNILRYLIDITNDSDYIMDIDEELDMSLLFKATGVKIEGDDSDFLGNITKYIELACGLMKRKLIILINFRSYVCDNQYEEFIRMCRYKEINVLLMENHKNDCVSGVKQYILDSDRCEIF